MAQCRPSASASTRLRFPELSGPGLPPGQASGTAEWRHGLLDQQPLPSARGEVAHKHPSLSAGLALRRVLCSSPSQAGAIHRDTAGGGRGRSPRQSRGGGSDGGICWTQSGGEVGEAGRASVPRSGPGAAFRCSHAIQQLSERSNLSLLPKHVFTRRR